MHIKQCRFLLNTLSQTVQKQKLPVTPKMRSRILINAVADTNPYNAEITINKFFNCKLFRPLIKKLIKHESKHVDQLQIMARYIAGMADNTENGLNNFRKFIARKYPLYEDIYPFNKKFYQESIESRGVIKEGHPQFEKAKEYIKAFKEYPDLSILDDLGTLTDKGLKEAVKNFYKKIKLYRNNLLEVEARRYSKQK